MAIKLKANGTPVSSLSNDKLSEVHAKGGKQGHKARMELIRRGEVDANAKAA
jgi:hypothetical protein